MCQFPTWYACCQRRNDILHDPSPFVFELQKWYQDFIQRITCWINQQASPRTIKSKHLGKNQSWARSASGIWAALHYRGYYIFSPSQFLLSLSPSLHSTAVLVLAIKILSKCILSGRQFLDWVKSPGFILIFCPFFPIPMCLILFKGGFIWSSM